MAKFLDIINTTPSKEVKSDSADWDAIGKPVIRQMYRHLNLIRVFEEKVIELHNQGLVHGPAHTSIWQEAGAVGSIAQLRKSDQITGSHRGHHQFLAKALMYVDGDLKTAVDYKVSTEVENMLQRSLAEIMGLAQGYCKGRGGSMHLRWSEAGAQGTNAIVGGGVPIANGLAWAKKQQGKGDCVFTYLGDGAVNIGSVAESMNLAGVWKLPICFFIENNGYAVSTKLEEQTAEKRLAFRGLAYGIPSFGVDGMDPVAVYMAVKEALKIMRSGGGSTIIEAEVYRLFHHNGGIQASAFGYRSKAEEKEWADREPLAAMTKKLYDRGWLKKGEGEEISSQSKELLNRISDNLTEMVGKKRVIIPSLWPDPSFCDVGIRGDMSEFDGSIRFEEQETFSGELAERNYLEIVPEVMARRMETDERVFCLGEDIHRMKGGIHGATRGLAEKFPDRVLPTPIAELGFTGLAGGVAMEGTYRPVVELMFPDFSLCAADQLFNQIGKSRHMFGGEANMPIVVRTKTSFGTGYGAQHSMDPAGLYTLWPGWRIVAPSTPFDYVGLMNSALLCEDPVLVIEHVDLYNSNGIGPVSDLDYYIPLGKAKVVLKGSTFTVLTYSAMTPLALEAAEKMGLDVEIIDLRSLDRAGLDWETIGESIKKTNNVVVLEQNPLTVSYGEMVSDEIQRRYFDYLDQPVQRIHGGEAATSVSKVLERAAYVGSEEITTGFELVLREMGQPFNSAG
ncbi:MAG: MFS transporter [Deltaproteobacteria bacterium]|jgi:2-oxoisovalerate dehydrogenase E1 component|nr:MFS transporter [Deltaproteobacteria bacterium]MBT4642212.1 MFS transporter [Deltaproteobacteria bacterium]MBT6502539.1 MFS transporter [Deltaproteobacteria bacterium]MBT6613168.1 MFS transporter [Deltaproteobacteria bacterium]MBT7155180.1 MFS transporter [Deltaproteobacteria bacterium]